MNPLRCHPRSLLLCALVPFLLVVLSAPPAFAGDKNKTPVAKGFKKKGDHRYESKRNLMTNHMSRNQDGTINVVVEIPSGTNEKWEVSDDGKSLVRDFTGKNPRTVDYLPYPGNYGMIPRTLLDPERGGDGGALDVMVLGPAVPRGTTLRAHPIGIIRIVDRMEQDDKILAVMRESTLRGVTDIESLDARYPGASEIVRTWWSNAHGRRAKVNMMGSGSRGQANKVIDFAIESYRKDGLRKAAEKAEQEEDE
jgi:inorganic pyrophosphatase